MANPWAMLLTPLERALRKKITDKVLASLLNKVLDIHSQELEALLRIEEKLDDLLAGPFNAGLAWLESARLPHRTAAERLEYTEQALKKFIEAQAQLKGFDRAVSQLYVGVAHGLLGHGQDFEIWIVRARKTADEAITAALWQAQARQGFLTGSFGRSRRASRAFLQTLAPNQSLIAGLNSFLAHLSPIEWSYEIAEWEEWIPPVEQFESGWTKRRALRVRRDGSETELAAP